MSVYTKDLIVDKSDYELYKEYLEIDDICECTKEYLKSINAVKYDSVNIGVVEFENGYGMSIDLYSGSQNYYIEASLLKDNVYIDDYYALSYELDTPFKISDDDGNTYIVNIVQV